MVGERRMKIEGIIALALWAAIAVLVVIALLRGGTL